MAAEMETVYTVRCPLGEQCSKKGGVLAKKSSDEDARAAVAWHLQASPYHELSKEEAANQGAVAEVEVTEEEKAAVEEQEKDEGQEWPDNRKRQKRSSGTELARVGHHGGGSSSHGGGHHGGGHHLAVPIRGRRHGHEETVVLNKIQVQACVDSLRRAKAAAESAGQLCAKASRAFFSEADFVQNCQEVLETYVQD